MTVEEAIAKLQEMPQQAELHICIRSHGTIIANGSQEVDEIRMDSATYGILTKTPKSVQTVVLDVSWCGL